MKFNMIFKIVKEMIMKYWLQILGCTTSIIMIVAICSAALTPKETDKFSPKMELEWYQTQLDIYTQKQDNAHKMAEAARGLGYLDNHAIIQTAKKEWAQAQIQIKELENKITELKLIIETKNQERKTLYPVATEVWEFLTEKGYNEYVVAGILGNMMAEAGGQTLSIQVDAYSPGYYGICQWSLKYNPQLNNSNLQTQLEHLASSMEYEFNTFGKNYKRGFNYEAFLNMTDEKEAALAFAKCYERCTSASHKKRKENATKAYEFFLT